MWIGRKGCCLFWLLLVLLSMMLAETGGIHLAERDSVCVLREGGVNERMRVCEVNV